MKKRICGLTLPDEINDYIWNTAKREHRSLANVVSMIIINYYKERIKK